MCYALPECGKTKFQRFRIKYSNIKALHQWYLKDHEIWIYENTIKLLIKL